MTSAAFSTNMQDGRPDRFLAEEDICHTAQCICSAPGQRHKTASPSVRTHSRAGEARDRLGHRRRQLRDQPRRSAGLLRPPWNPRGSTGRHHPRHRDRAVAHEHPPPRRTRQRPRPGPPAGRRARRHRPQLEPGDTGMDSRLATPLRLPHPAPGERCAADRGRAGSDPARRRHRTLARFATPELGPAQRRTATPTRHTRREEGPTRPQSGGEDGHGHRAARRRRSLPEGPPSPRAVHRAGRRPAGPRRRRAAARRHRTPHRDLDRQSESPPRQARRHPARSTRRAGRRLGEEGWERPGGTAAPRALWAPGLTHARPIGAGWAPALAPCPGLRAVRVRCDETDTSPGVHLRARCRADYSGCRSRPRPSAARAREPRASPSGRG